MKKATKITITFFGFLLAVNFFACQKDAVVTSSPQLESSKTSSIKKNEPVVFTLPQVATGSTVNWTVNPNANAIISSNGNQAAIKFAQKGDYTVIAVAENVRASSLVSVIDSTYPGSGTLSSILSSTVLPFSGGEVLKIAVSRVDSVSSGLQFSVLTTNNYNCLNNSLLSSSTFGKNSFTINYTGVSVPSNCTTGTAKASGFNFLYPVSSGTNTLTINFNGTNYTGTIIKTDKSYTINWSYATGVVISPTSL